MWLFLWFGLAVLVGVLAASRGRSGLAYALVSMVLSPLIGFIFVIATENLAAKKAADAALPSDRTHVRCTKCAEFVLPQAVVCKHCGAELVPQPLDRRIADQKRNAKEDAENLSIGIGAVVVVLFAAWLVSRCVGS